MDIINYTHFIISIGYSTMSQGQLDNGKVAMYTHIRPPKTHIYANRLSINAKQVAGQHLKQRHRCRVVLLRDSTYLYRFMIKSSSPYAFEALRIINCDCKMN